MPGRKGYLDSSLCKEQVHHAHNNRHWCIFSPSLCVQRVIQSGVRAGIAVFTYKWSPMLFSSVTYCVPQYLHHHGENLVINNKNVHDHIYPYLGSHHPFHPPPCFSYFWHSLSSKPNTQWEWGLPFQVTKLKIENIWMHWFKLKCLSSFQNSGQRDRQARQESGVWYK